MNSMTITEFARLGGKARAEKLSPERRCAIAKLAAFKRDMGRFQAGSVKLRDNLRSRLSLQSNLSENELTNFRQLLAA